MALISIGAITALFAALSFGSLAIIQCLLYAASLTFEFLALLVLRIRFPRAHRAFRVPGGWLGMAYVCLTPFGFAALVLFSILGDWRSFPGQLFVVGIVLASGGVLYLSGMASRFATTQRVLRRHQILPRSRLAPGKKAYQHMGANCSIFRGWPNHLSVGGWAARTLCAISLASLLIVLALAVAAGLSWER